MHLASGEPVADWWGEGLANTPPRVCVGLIWGLGSVQGAEPDPTHVHGHSPPGHLHMPFPLAETQFPHLEIYNPDTVALLGE